MKRRKQMANKNYVRLMSGRYLVITKDGNENIMTEVEAANEKEAEDIMNKYMINRGRISPIVAVCRIPAMIGYID